SASWENPSAAALIHSTEQSVRSSNKCCPPRAAFRNSGCALAARSSRSNPSAASRAYRATRGSSATPRTRPILKPLEATYRNRAVPAGTVRYWSWLFAAAESRAPLLGIYALRAEWQALMDPATEPNVAHLKLAWWQEEMQRLPPGAAAHPTNRYLAPPPPGGLGRLPPAAARGPGRIGSSKRLAPGTQRRARAAIPGTVGRPLDRGV